MNHGTKAVAQAFDSSIPISYEWDTYTSWDRRIEGLLWK